LGFQTGCSRPNPAACGYGSVPNTVRLSVEMNVTNGTAIKNGLLELTAAKPARWTGAIHNKVGNTLLADGSVRLVNIAGLRTIVTNTSFAINRLQMPVLTP